MPGKLDSRLPATFNVPTRGACSQSAMRCASDAANGRATTRCGRLKYRMYFKVSAHPCDDASPSMIVASASFTLQPVRGGYSCDACSRSPNSASQGAAPAEVRHPAGAQPPVAKPQARAANNPAWSAPVCPPLMIRATNARYPVQCGPGPRFEARTLRLIHDWPAPRAHPTADA